VDRFGPERVFWGSDLSRLLCRYEDWLGLFRYGLTELTRRERALILGDGLALWLGLRHEPTAATETGPRKTHQAGER
jgi:hypothetical protein